MRRQVPGPLSPPARRCCRKSVGIFEGFSHNGNDGAEMLARSQFRHDSAVGLVRGDLRVTTLEISSSPDAHDGRGCLVAGALDAQDEIHHRSHISSWWVRIGKPEPGWDAFIIENRA